MPTIKEKVMTALDKIGNVNGTAAPTSQDPIVADVHEYNVATMGESHFKARRDKAKKKLEKQLNQVQLKKINKAIEDTINDGAGTTVTLIDTDTYTVQLETKNGQSFVDIEALKVILMRRFKLDATKCEALFEEVTKRRNPAQSWKVVER
jgi:hypothetical protein